MFVRRLFFKLISKPSPSKRCRLIKVRGTGCVTKKARSNKPTFVFFPQSWNTCNERWILLSGSWFEENRVAHIDDLISTLNTAVIPPYHYSLVLKVRSRLVSCRDEIRESFFPTLYPPLSLFFEMPRNTTPKRCWVTTHERLRRRLPNRRPNLKLSWGNIKAIVRGNLSKWCVQNM